MSMCRMYYLKQNTQVFASQTRKIVPQTNESLLNPRMCLIAIYHGFPTFLNAILGNSRLIINIPWFMYFLSVFFVVSIDFFP